MRDPENGLLDLEPTEIHRTIDDDLDTSSLSCLLDGSYLCVQVCHYLEDDPIFDLHYFEFGDQSRGGYMDVERLVLARGHISFTFGAGTLFLDQFHAIRIALPGGIDADTVDFLVNAMFLGDKVEHAHGIVGLGAIRQHSFRERL